jgi:hypothetical protein
MNGFMIERDNHRIVHGGVDEGHMARCDPESGSPAPDHFLRCDGMRAVKKPSTPKAPSVVTVVNASTQTATPRQRHDTHVNLSRVRVWWSFRTGWRI